MTHPLRKCLTVGVATITASAIAFAPSIEPASPPAPAPPQILHVATPAITLTAGVQPLATASVTDILALIAQHYAVPPSAGQPFPAPQFPPVVAPTSIGSSIIAIYNAVEPWVEWGFDVAAYAVGWIPYVGWLSGQIPIFYDFGERIARSITYNIANWLDGNISFGQGLINVGIATVEAFIQLGIDQWNFWLWPLPPLPPIFPGTAVAETTQLTTAAAITEDASSEAQKLNKKVAGEAADVDPSTAADEAAEEDQKKSGADAVKEAKEPKSTTSTLTGTAAQGDVRGLPNETTPGTTKVNNGNKKGDKGPTAEGTSETSASASANDDTGAKRDKKDGTGK